MNIYLIKSLSLLVLISANLSLASCEHKTRRIPVQAVSKYVTISTCRISPISGGIMDSESPQGEFWEIISETTIEDTNLIDQLIEYKKGKDFGNSVAVPLCPYRDLIICNDEQNKPLLALAEKACGECVRISNFEITKEGLIFIGGDKVFENLIYTADTSMAKRLRELVEALTRK